jgi:hypothetical protein
LSLDDIREITEHAGLFLARYQLAFLAAGGGAILGHAPVETPAPIPVPKFERTIRFERRNCGGPIDWLLVRLV